MKPSLKELCVRPSSIQFSAIKSQSDVLHLERTLILCNKGVEEATATFILTSPERFKLVLPDGKILEDGGPCHHDTLVVKGSSSVKVSLFGSPVYLGL